jgi:hypothetical protein
MTHALRYMFASRLKQSAAQISAPGAVYNQQDVHVAQIKKIGSFEQKRIQNVILLGIKARSILKCSFKSYSPSYVESHIFPEVFRQIQRLVVHCLQMINIQCSTFTPLLLPFRI